MSLSLCSLHAKLKEEEVKYIYYLWNILGALCISANSSHVSSKNDLFCLLLKLLSQIAGLIAISAINFSTSNVAIDDISCTFYVLICVYNNFRAQMSTIRMAENQTQNKMQNNLKTSIQLSVQLLTNTKKITTTKLS